MSLVQQVKFSGEFRDGQISLSFEYISTSAISIPTTGTLQLRATAYIRTNPARNGPRPEDSPAASAWAGEVERPPEAVAHHCYH